jgi:hypothetical protein
MRIPILLLGATLAAAAPAAAQRPVLLQFDGGRVTLRAENAPVRMILAEWARLGGALVVNGEKVIGAPVTLELVGVPEKEALDIVLRRAVAGYVLTGRRAGTHGASAFDRILIVPASTVPAPVPATAPSAIAAGTRQPVPLPPMLARRPELGVEGVPPPRTDESPRQTVVPLRPFITPPAAGPAEPSKQN